MKACNGRAFCFIEGTKSNSAIYKNVYLRGHPEADIHKAVTIPQKSATIVPSTLNRQQKFLNRLLGRAIIFKLLTNN